MSLIISLTSTSARIPILRYTLLSILEQSYKADRIVLCISRTGYLIDQGIADLPDWLCKMCESNQIEIKWVENTGPYRKLLPIYHSSTKDDWIVTCDDDVIYGPEWLGSLVNDAQKHPQHIVCGRARIPTNNAWGKRQSYLNWRIVPLGSEGVELLPIGIAGVLYRKPLLNDAVMNSDKFKEFAPKQDDLWFHLARRVAGGKVYVSTEAGKHVFPIEAPGALSSTNSSFKAAGWDRIWNAIFDRLKIKIRAYLGFSSCDNDIALNKLENYRKSLS